TRADADRVSDVGPRRPTARLRGALNLIPFARYVDAGADEWVDERIPSELIQLTGRHGERAERMFVVRVCGRPIRQTRGEVAVRFGGPGPRRLDFSLEVMGPVASGNQATDLARRPIPAA